MATTIETEVEDLQEVVQKREPSAKSGSEKPESSSGVPSRRFSRWILLFAAALAVAGELEQVAGVPVTVSGAHRLDGFHREAFDLAAAPVHE